MSKKAEAEAAYYAAMMEGADHAAAGELEDAAAAFSEATELANEVGPREGAEAALQLAVARAQLGRLDAALEDIDAIVEALAILDPPDTLLKAKAHGIRASVLEVLDRRPEAISEVRASIACFEAAKTRGGDPEFIATGLDAAREQLEALEALEA